MPPLFADVSFSTESLAVVTTLVVALVGGIVAMFKMLLAAKDTHMAAKDARIKEIQEDRDSYKNIADDALASLETMVNKERKRSGRTDFTKLAPVVPEQNSPISLKQRSDAKVATARARLVAAKLDLGLHARQEDDPHAESGPGVRPGNGPRTD